MARANHRAVPAILLVVAMALMAAQAAAEASTPGRSHEEETSTLALPLATRVRCTGLHVVRPGETCESVARAAELTVAQFLQLNQNLTCAALHHGQWVCISGTVIGA